MKVSLVPATYGSMLAASSLLIVELKSAAIIQDTPPALRPVNIEGIPAVKR